MIASLLVHRDAPGCPPGARAMMGDAHRVGCSTGPACESARPTHGGSVRAEFYHRTARGDGLRARYLCAACAARLSMVVAQDATGGG